MRGGHEAPLFELIGQLRGHPELDSAAIVTLLWREEAPGLLEERGQGRGLRGSPGGCYGGTPGGYGSARIVTGGAGIPREASGGRRAGRSGRRTIETGEGTPSSPFLPVV